MGLKTSGLIRRSLSALALSSLLLPSCNYSAGKKKSTLKDDNCRELFKKKEDCHLGETGSEATLSKTFETSATEQTWAESTGDFDGFNLVLPAGSFSAPLTVTVRLFQSKSSANSYIQISGDKDLTAAFAMIPPTLVRTRFEVDNYQDIIVNFVDSNGLSSTLGAELNRAGGALTINSDVWGKYGFTMAREPQLVSIKLKEQDTTIIHKLTAKITPPVCTPTLQKKTLPAWCNGHSKT